MRISFVGKGIGDKLEIIEVAPSRFQYIYLNGDDRGISKVHPGPVEPLIREAIELGWVRLPEDSVERDRDLAAKRRASWLASFRMDFKPSSFKPKKIKPKRTQAPIEFTELPLP